MSFPYPLPETDTIRGTDLIRLWRDDEPEGLDHEPRADDSEGAVTWRVDRTVCGDYVGCLEYRANRKVLEDEYPALVATMHYGHSTTDAIVTVYPGQVYPTDTVRDLLSDLEALTRYPILDDEAASEEIEAAASEQWERDTLPDIIRNVDDTLEDTDPPPYHDPNAEALTEWWVEGSDVYWEGRTVEYTTVYWDADDIAENIVKDATAEQGNNGVPPLYIPAPWADPTNPIFHDPDSFARRVSAWNRAHLRPIISE